MMRNKLLKRTLSNLRLQQIKRVTPFLNKIIMQEEQQRDIVVPGNNQFHKKPPIRKNE